MLLCLFSVSFRGDRKLSQSFSFNTLYVYKLGFRGLTVCDHVDKHKMTNSKTFIFHSSGRRSLPSQLSWPMTAGLHFKSSLNVFILGSWWGNLISSMNVKVFFFLLLLKTKTKTEVKVRELQPVMSWTLTALIHTAECAHRAAPLQLPPTVKLKIHTHARVHGPGFQNKSTNQTHLWLGNN